MGGLAYRCPLTGDLPLIVLPVDKVGAYRRQIDLYGDLSDTVRKRRAEKMMIEAHIGRLHEPGFDLFHGDYNGNIPKKLSPFLPDAHRVHRYLWSMVRSGAENVRQLDWGAVGAIMTKRQLADFIDSFYNNGGFDELRAFIRELDPVEPYMLVAYETGDSCEE